MRYTTTPTITPLGVRLLSISRAKLVALDDLPAGAKDPRDALRRCVLVREAVRAAWATIDEPTTTPSELTNWHAPSALGLGTLTEEDEDEEMAEEQWLEDALASTEHEPWTETTVGLPAYDDYEYDDAEVYNYTSSVTVMDVDEDDMELDLYDDVEETEIEAIVLDDLLASEAQPEKPEAQLLDADGDGRTDQLPRSLAMSQLVPTEIQVQVPPLRPSLPRRAAFTISADDDDDACLDSYGDSDQWDEEFDDSCPGTPCETPPLQRCLSNDSIASYDDEAECRTPPLHPAECEGMEEAALVGAYDDAEEGPDPRDLPVKHTPSTKTFYNQSAPAEAGAPRFALHLDFQLKLDSVNGILNRLNLAPVQPVDVNVDISV